LLNSTNPYVRGNAISNLQNDVYVALLFDFCPLSVISCMEMSYLFAFLIALTTKYAAVFLLTNINSTVCVRKLGESLFCMSQVFTQNNIHSCLWNSE